MWLVTERTKKKENQTKKRLGIFRVIGFFLPGCTKKYQYWYFLPGTFANLVVLTWYFFEVPGRYISKKTKKLVKQNLVQSKTWYIKSEPGTLKV